MVVVAVVLDGNLHRQNLGSIHHDVLIGKRFQLPPEASALFWINCCGQIRDIYGFWHWTIHQYFPAARKVRSGNRTEVYDFGPKIKSVGVWGGYVTHYHLASGINPEIMHDYTISPNVRAVGRVVSILGGVGLKASEDRTSKRKSSSDLGPKKLVGSVGAVVIVCGVVLLSKVPSGITILAHNSDLTLLSANENLCTLWHLVGG